MSGIQSRHAFLELLPSDLCAMCCWHESSLQAPEGLGFRVQGLGFRVQALGFRVQALGFRVEDFIEFIVPKAFHNGFLDVVEEFVGVWGLVLGLPIGSIVVPFWDYLIGSQL